VLLQPEETVFPTKETRSWQTSPGPALDPRWAHRAADADHAATTLRKGENAGHRRPVAETKERSWLLPDQQRRPGGRADVRRELGAVNPGGAMMRPLHFNNGVLPADAVTAPDRA
jgi:hypothetical protein